MDQLHLMTVYVAVAEEQGFAAGARRLGLSPPAVTRAVATLEEHLGVKLLNRTTRYVRTTEAGLRYLDDARKIIADVQVANEAAAGVNGEPRGHLSVTAPVLFGQIHVMPGIVRYLQRYPETEVNAIFLDRVVNLIEEGLDVGIRIGELPDSSMRALRVGSVRNVLCASPDYLRQFGIPGHPKEIMGHTIIHSRAGDSSVEWTFDGGAGPLSIRVKPRLTVTTNDAAIVASREGLGVCRLLSYQAAQYVDSGELDCILMDFEPPSIPIHIVHREGHLASTKVRSFIDLMAEYLRQDKRLNDS